MLDIRHQQPSTLHRFCRTTSYFVASVGIRIGFGPTEVSQTANRWTTGGESWTPFFFRERFGHPLFPVLIQKKSRARSPDNDRHLRKQVGLSGETISWRSGLQADHRTREDNTIRYAIDAVGREYKLCRVPALRLTAALRMRKPHGPSQYL